MIIKVFDDIGGEVEDIEVKTLEDLTKYISKLKEKQEDEITFCEVKLGYTVNTNYGDEKYWHLEIDNDNLIGDVEDEC